MEEAKKFQYPAIHTSETLGKLVRSIRKVDAKEDERHDVKLGKRVLKCLRNIEYLCNSGKPVLSDYDITLEINTYRMHDLLMDVCEDCEFMINPRTCYREGFCGAEKIQERILEVVRKNYGKKGVKPQIHEISVSAEFYSLLRK